MTRTDPNAAIASPVDREKRLPFENARRDSAAEANAPPRVLAVVMEPAHAGDPVISTARSDPVDTTAPAPKPEKICAVERIHKVRL